jgi:hypothetical protein
MPAILLPTDEAQSIIKTKDNLRRVLSDTNTKSNADSDDDELLRSIKDLLSSLDSAEPYFNQNLKPDVASTQVTETETETETRLAPRWAGPKASILTMMRDDGQVSRSHPLVLVRPI